MHPQSKCPHYKAWRETSDVLRTSECCHSKFQEWQIVCDNYGALYFGKKCPFYDPEVLPGANADG